MQLSPDLGSSPVELTKLVEEMNRMVIAHRISNLLYCLVGQKEQGFKISASLLVKS